MESKGKIIVISNINFEYRDVLLERLYFRLGRENGVKLLIIVDDEINISESSYKILEKIRIPFLVVKDIKKTPFSYMLKDPIPNLNQFPFPYLTIDRDCNNNVVESNLAMDPQLNLMDNHMHTQLAYCNFNMEVETAIKLGKLFGLKAINFTEHSSQLYFNVKNYNSRDCYINNVYKTDLADHRIKQYLDFKKKYSNDFVQFGLELDFDFNGTPMIMENDLKKFDYILGAMHQLPEINVEQFLLQMERVLKYGVDVIAHPFRIFKRNGMELPTELFRPTAEMLKKYNTAAEINFHTNNPPVEFIKICLELGVLFSFGSDSHNLGEIGDFSPHIKLLRDAGFHGDINDVLWVMDKVPAISK